MTATLETGIPVPKRKSSRKYPFAKLAIGESYFVKLEGQTSNLMTLQQSILSNCRYHQIKVHTRIVPEENGVRVWRRAE